MSGALVLLDSIREKSRIELVNDTRICKMRMIDLSFYFNRDNTYLSIEVVQNSPFCFVRFVFIYI